VSPELFSALHEGWQLVEVSADAGPQEIASLPESAWLAACVPGTAHGALLAAGRIPDPFYGRNELEVRWVGERAWAWRLRFEGGEMAMHEELVFEGLDTYCTAWLNGEPLLTSDNMFVPQRVNVRERLRPGANELLLRFDPALARARAVEALHGKRALWNGDSSRLHVRKSQYHFGWDWGPELLTCGPWRAVRRHAWSVRVDELQCVSEIDLERASASLQVSARIEGELSGLDCRFRLRDPDGRCVAELSLPATAAHGRINVEQARLWWPRGLGEQPLYTLELHVLAGVTVLAEDSRRIGLRRLRLLQEPVAGLDGNEAGSSFHFEVNGTELFAGGANWIPDDSLLERITPERYRERVGQAAAANMNMLRVWGGGVYEQEAFYEACDEQGLLIWQDFMFACGVYPANAEFLASVRAEAESAIKRLRHHPCLALWCGNNEDYQIAESVGLYGPGVPLEKFEALAIYEQLLPEVCAALDPQRPYWPGSPFTPRVDGIGRTTDPTSGDRHSWEVWHQQMLPYQRYGDVQGRFVSEFGLQSHPSLALFESVLPEGERFPESRTAQWHNKAGSAAGPDGHRRLSVYLADNLRTGSSLADHVYATQFVQAEAMRVAYQDFRRRWQRPGARAVSGALVWQLNDCWPVTSWALIDSSGEAKPAWHAVRRALASLSVSLRLESGRARMVLMNAPPEPCPARLELRVFALDGRLLVEHELLAEFAPNGTVELIQALPDFGEEPVAAELCAFDARGAAELARDCAWTEPFKFHRLPEARITASRERNALLLSTDKPVKGLWLSAQGSARAFEDNFIDLMPGLPRKVAVRGEPPRRLEFRALDQPGSAIREGGIEGK